MIKALNAFMGAVFEPVFVLALLALLLMLIYRQIKRPVPAGIWIVGGIFTVSLIWRVIFSIGTSRYSAAAVIPAAILAAWLTGEWLRCGWHDKPGLRWRQWLLVIGVAGLAVGAGVKMLKSERDLYSEFYRAGQDMHKALADAVNPAVLMTSSHGIRAAYYGRLVRNAQGEPMAYELIGGGWTEKLKKAVDSHDMLIAVTRRGEAEETLRQLLTRMASPAPEVRCLGEYFGRRNPFAVLLIDNRKSRNFGFASLTEAEPLPPESTLLLAENFDAPVSVAVDQDQVLRQYRELGFVFAKAPSVVLPSALTLVNHGKISGADKEPAGFCVKPGTWGNANHLFSSMTTYHLVRIKVQAHQYRRYIVEFEVKGTPGSYVDIGMLQYQGKKYLGEQQRCGYFYALSDRYRFFRMELTAPVQNTDQFAVSMYLHGDLELGSMKIYGVP